jgi:hypothetical protein
MKRDGFCMCGFDVYDIRWVYMMIDDSILGKLQKGPWYT